MGCAAAVSGDVTVNVDTVMCNCAAPNNENYVRMHEAHVECGAYPEGAAGHASCITNTLGFLSVDGRSADVAGLTAMFGESAAECILIPSWEPTLKPKPGLGPESLILLTWMLF